MTIFAMALFFILFSDLIRAKTLLIETENSEEENGSGWIPNSWLNDWNGNDYNDCKNLRECLQQKMKLEKMRPTRIDPLGEGK